MFCLGVCRDRAVANMSDFHYYFFMMLMLIFAIIRYCFASHDACYVHARRFCFTETILRYASATSASRARHAGALVKSE